MYKLRFQRTIKAIFTLHVQGPAPLGDPSVPLSCYSLFYRRESFWGFKPLLETQTQTPDRLPRKVTPKAA